MKVSTWGLKECKNKKRCMLIYFGCYDWHLIRDFVENEKSREMSVMFDQLLDVMMCMSMIL